MSQMIYTHLPNRTQAREVQGTNAWRMVASDGNVYSSYVALLAAGKTPWPGAVTDFPIGVPAMNIRTVNSTSLADGDMVLVKTNTTITPTGVTDVDFPVSGSGQMVSPPGGIKYLWIQQKTAGDLTVITGYF